MTLTDLDPAYRPFVVDLLRRHGFDPDELDLALPADDEMWSSVLAG